MPSNISLSSFSNQPASSSVTLIKLKAASQIKQNGFVINIANALRHILGEKLEAAALGVRHRPVHEPTDRCDVTVTEQASGETRAEHGRPTMCTND